MNNTPETDELVRSLNYEQLASTEKCYSEMRTLARSLERDRDEQCRLLGMSGERECDLRGKLDRERGLADRLADALEGIWPFLEEDIPHGCNSTAYMNSIELCRANITAWKEARND